MAPASKSTAFAKAEQACDAAPVSDSLSGDVVSKTEKSTRESQFENRNWTMGGPGAKIRTLCESRKGMRHARVGHFKGLPPAKGIEIHEFCGSPGLLAASGPLTEVMLA